MPGNDFKLDVVSVRLVKDAPILAGYPLSTPEAAVEAIGQYLCDFDREIVCVVNLKADMTPINCHFASMGALTQALAEPRELFKASILSNAANMILIHCHPSGRLEPSKDDCMLTDRMIKLCELMGIPLVDHVIVGGQNREYFSFKNKKKMSNPNIILCTDYKTIDFQNMLVAEKGKAR